MLLQNLGREGDWHFKFLHICLFSNYLPVSSSALNMVYHQYKRQYVIRGTFPNVLRGVLSQNANKLTGTLRSVSLVCTTGSCFFSGSVGRCCSPVIGNSSQQRALLVCAESNRYLHQYCWRRARASALLVIKTTDLMKQCGH